MNHLLQNLTNSIMIIEIHILQNYAPSNLNRDDSGAPKDCNFGGHRRQRISSQCLKRSVRKSEIFERLMKDRLGLRTKRTPEAVAKKLVTLGYEEASARAMADSLLEELYGLSDKGETAYLLYIGPEEIQRGADLLHEQGEENIQRATELNKLKKEEDLLKKDKNAAKKDKEIAAKAVEEARKPFADLANKYKKMYPKHVRAIDVALFGRMLANSPTENVDAACQVAHAISVNRMTMEFDFFTAVDDLKPEDNSGAGMIGTVGFASSCFYRFACINTSQLDRNLGGDEASAREGLMAFAEAFIYARPSGKQNTFAAHSLPSLILFVTRETGQPLSLANAFENPAYPSEERSLTEDAIQKLSKHYIELKKMYGLDGTAACVILNGNETIAKQLTDAGVAIEENVSNLLEALKKSLSVQPVVS